MDVLIDTNVVLDYMAKRQPHFEQSKTVIDLCVEGEINGCIAAHSITNLFFILRNDMSVSERKIRLLKLCDMFTVVSLDSSKIVSALTNNSFDDFEDCLQDECAIEFEAKYVITRNTNDFKNSKIKAIEPSEFLKMLKTF